MSLGSKHTLVQFCSEGAKQLPLANAPIGGVAQYIVTQATEVSPEVLWTVHKQLDDIKGFSERDELDKKEKQFLL